MAKCTGVLCRMPAGYKVDDAIAKTALAGQSILQTQIVSGQCPILN